MRQVAAGRYAATIVADTSGVYELDVAEPSAPRKPGRHETNGFVVPPLVETTSFAANEQVLRRIASETGGTVLSDSRAGDLYPTARASNASRWDPIWAAFAVLGLVAFVLDVAVRRLRPSTLRALLGGSVTSKGSQ